MWAWAAQQRATLGFEMVVLGILLATSVTQQRRRARRLKRLAQLVEDLDEERTVKDQAVATASQMCEALEKKLGRYTQLQSIAQELSNMTDLGSIAQLAVDCTFRLIGKSDVCLLLLVDKERQELSLVASRKRESITSIRAKRGDQFDRHVLRTHRPLLVNDVRRDFRFTVTVHPDRTIHSVIACPLFFGQSPEGVLRLDSAQPNAYTQDDLRFLDILLELIAAAMHNARLFAQTQQLAMTDGLTGLALRRPFLEQLNRELVRAARSREPVSVLMLDVDHFKDYNDAFGHTAGDLILKSVAEVLRAAVTPGGLIARYGGEEFAALLPRVSRAQASQIAERIRSLMEQQVYGLARPMAGSVGMRARSMRHVTLVGESKEHRPVTVSLGVSVFPDDAQADLELIRVADQRLYAAKHAGRNLVVCS
jgi:diguanylate cyclase (GGDEF)-like protein